MALSASSGLEILLWSPIVVSSHSGTKWKRLGLRSLLINGFDFSIETIRTEVQSLG